VKGLVLVLSFDFSLRLQTSGTLISRSPTSGCRDCIHDDNNVATSENIADGDGTNYFIACVP